MAYKIYIDEVLLPVAPESINYKMKNRNETKVLINDGEVNVPKSAGLTTISFTALLPASPAYYAEYESGFANPLYFIEKFRALKSAGKPFLLDVFRLDDYGNEIYTPSEKGTDSNAVANAGERQKTSSRVTLEKYDINDDVTDGADLSVNLEFKLWKDYQTKYVVIKDGKATVVSNGSTSTSSTEKPKTYTVQAGDTLCAIAKKYLGSDALWETLYKLNADVIEKVAKENGHESSLNGGYIFPDTVLKLS